ncbi:MAG TPA: RluA family pseudouridine synthase [Rhabdochlamydiaceae bacterium]|jgi:23S rRNA pseudouridine1911/1915/1917 synthase
MEEDSLITVSLEEVGLRMDKLLTQRFADHSRTYFQFLIEKGCILVNGLPRKKRETLKAGDEIEVCFLLTPEIALEAESIPLDILYEDEDLLAVNKPAGMVVHPGPGHSSGTFVHALLHHCKNLGSEDPLRPGIVHRLDKDTSGVLLAAKTPLAHSRLITLFSERQIKKTYRAICMGRPKEDLIDAPIGRHPTQRQQMSICPSRGKEAKTLVRTTIPCKQEGLFCAELELITGRTHQIRVHLRHAGTPVLGDPVYGSSSANKKFNATRQLLHACSVSFPHPLHRQQLEISAPLPEDFRIFCEKIAVAQ